MDESIVLPVRYARLIVKFTHGLLSEAEREELDEWICASDENLEIFEHLTGDVLDKMIDPEALVEETDDVVELWMIAGLIARERTNNINEAEKRMLSDWIKASEANENIYKALINPANFQKFVIWLRPLTKNNDPMMGLN